MKIAVLEVTKEIDGGFVEREIRLFTTIDKGLIFLKKEYYLKPDLIKLGEDCYFGEGGINKNTYSVSLYMQNVK